MAYKKIEKMGYNVVYDKWIEDDSKVDEIVNKVQSFKSEFHSMYNI